MYSISGYGSMMWDRVRMPAYEEALRRSVSPGCVVLDLGAGTGIMSLLACRFGARRVYAVEPADAIHLARELAVANGFGDRIVFHQQDSTKLSLPEPVHVIVADLRGVLPLYHGNLAILADARRRFLKPGGRLLPARDTLWAALVEAPTAYHQLVNVWRENGFGFNLEAARRLMANNPVKERVRPEQLLTEPQSWAMLDYTIRDEPNVRGECHWTAQRSGNAHGLCLWFEGLLLDGVPLSNRPGAPEMIYGQNFFPLVESIPIAAGDRVDVTLDARLVGDDYVWSWETQVFSAAGVELAHFRQSTLAATPLTPASLRKRAADHVPVLEADGELDCFILARIDGVQSLEAIARQTAATFPERFATWLQALARVGELSQKYSR